ncbi:MAG TPA: formate/nitrite transporter family protein [Steroidobacteraceae bacterium]|nr:formate/nitrite transporter family protein [Steroidobacteraceae bacterium]
MATDQMGQERGGGSGSGPERLAVDQPLEKPQKSYHTILEQHVEQAQEELERPAGGLLLSSLSAGLDLGFGPLLMAVLLTLSHGDWPRPITRIVLAAAYAVGFVFVVLGRSALFTEQTTSAVLPVLAGRAGLLQLARLWSLVLLGNIAGGAVFARILSTLGPHMHIVDAAAFGTIAAKLLAVPWWTMWGSAVLAGWLMGLLAWLMAAARDTIGQIVFVSLTTFVIGMAGFHHSIAGTIEVLLGLFASAGPTWGDYLRFIAAAAVGNAFGGALFVALLKFGHVRASA